MEEEKRTDKPLHKEVRQLRYENALLKRQVKDLKQNLSICLNTNIAFLEIVTTYENYDDALKNLKPVKKIIKGEVIKTEESSRGEIKNRLLLIPRWWLKYDSRYFHKVVYGFAAPKYGVLHKKSTQGA